MNILAPQKNYFIGIYWYKKLHFLPFCGAENGRQAQSLLSLYDGLLIRWSSVRIAHNPPNKQQNINQLQRYFTAQKISAAPQKAVCSAKFNSKHIQIRAPPARELHRTDNF